MDKRRLLRLEQEHDAEVAREEQRERQRQLEQENELEARRAREDPLGHDRFMDAMDELLEAVDASDWSGDPNDDAPDDVVGAYRRFWELREEWLHGNTTSERTLNLSMRGEQDYGQTTQAEEQEQA